MQVFFRISYIVLISFFTSQVVAQKYSFVLETGYAMPSSKRLLFVTRTLSTSEAILGSYGSGINLSMGFDRAVNKHLNVGVKGRFNLGNKIKSVSLITAPNGIDAQVNIISRSNTYYFIPYISTQSSFDKQFQFYVSYGLIIAKPIIDFEYFQRNSTSTIETLSYKEKLTHKVNLGSSIESGISFVSGANGNAVITIGLEFITFSPLLAESEVIEFIHNGDDKLSSLSSPKVTYSKTVKTNDPKTALVDSSPYGSLGIKVGLKLKLLPKVKNG